MTRGRVLGCFCVWWEAQGQGEEQLGELVGLGCAEPVVWAGQELKTFFQCILHF